MKCLRIALASLLLCAFNATAVWSAEAAPGEAATAAFKDVPASHWGYTSIQRAYTDGAVSGSSYDEATGARNYSPEAKVTMAEFCTIIARAFYADELAASTAGNDPWYAAAQDVISSRRMSVGYFNSQDADVMNGAARRYDMAGLVYSVLKDKNVTLPTDAELAAVQSQIADWSDMNRIDRQRYQKAVSTVVALGLITGKDDQGTFAGMDNLTRAEVATIYCRLADLINGKTTVAKPVEQPNTGNYGPVGTLSDTPVTLSFSTHKPVVDYWSRTSAEVQAATDKDMFNAAVQTIKDKDIALQSNDAKIKNNEYYNYAVFDWEIAAESNKLGNLGGSLPLGFGAYRQLNNSDDSNLTVIVHKDFFSQYDDVFHPILSKLNDSMTDMQKAEILVQAVTDRFDYGKGNFDWHSENRIGDCDIYSAAVSVIFNAAGLVCYDDMGGNTAYGAHAWNRVYLDGKWYAVDATTAETGAHSTGIMTYAEHANLWGYDMDRYEHIQIKIRDALWNAVLNQ